MSPERRGFILEGVMKIRDLGLDYNVTARFGGKNLEDIPLQEFLSGHIVGLELFADNISSKIEKSNPELYKRIDWGRVCKIARYHDIVETEKRKDVPCPVKTEDDRKEEWRRTGVVVEKKIPTEQQNEVKYLLLDYHNQGTFESRLLKLLDKIHPHIYLMNDRYMEALLFTHSQWGIRNKPFQERRHEEIMGLLSELDIPELQDLYEVVWGRNVELGNLGEHPQEFMDFSTKTKEDV